METKQNYNTNDQAGFALLLTLIVVGVVVAIGVSVLDLSIKQVRLSTTARDSEISFHAANAGMECARYVRKTFATDMESGLGITPTCFAVAPFSNTVSEITQGVAGDGDVHLYRYSFTWGDVDRRCSEITTLIASSTALGSGVTISNMRTHVPGYPGSSNSKSCGAGQRCTVLSVRGFNKPCNSISDYGTVQREVLLQF